MKVPVRSGARSRRGAAAIELAIAMPLLMVLVLGCIDFGRFAYAYIAITNAARAGAGAGIMSKYPLDGVSLQAWQTLVCTAATNEIGPGGSNTFTATPVATGETGGLWRAQVTAQHPFHCVIPWPGIPSTLNLQRTVILRVIR